MKPTFIAVDQVRNMISNTFVPGNSASDFRKHVLGQLDTLGSQYLTPTPFDPPTKMCHVTFPGNYGKAYSFKFDSVRFPLRKGDYAICECSTGIQLVQVTAVENEVSPVATRWIVGSVDLTHYYRQKELFELKKQREAELKKVKAELDKKVKQMSVEDLYQRAADKDHSVKDLYERYQELQREY